MKNTQVPKALIAYASKYGSTAHIAEWIKTGMDFDTDVQHINNIKNMKQYDFIVLGSPMYNDAPLPEMESFIEKYKDVLQNKKKAIFAVTTNTESEEKNQHFLEAMKSLVPGEISEAAVFAGRMDIKAMSEQDETKVEKYLNSIEEPVKEYNFMDEERCRSFGKKLNQVLSQTV